MQQQDYIYPTNKYKIRQRSSSSLTEQCLTVTLSGLDLISPPMQIHNHRFYRLDDGVGDGGGGGGEAVYLEMIDRLKASLAEALELYPPVTSITTVDDKGIVSITMDRERPKGTPFIVHIADSPYTVDNENLSPRTDALLPPSASILAVKITKFTCGTICVASSINHQVTDLRGFLDFLELWARISRGEPVDFGLIPDDWSRTPGRFFPGAKMSSLPPAPFTPLSQQAPPPACLMVPSVISWWRINKRSMEMLKEDFTPNTTTNGQWISSGDALATVIIGAFTRARHLGNVPRLGGRSSVDSQIEKVAMAADGRERAPNGAMANGKYFGNFNNLWSVDIAREDLLDASSAAGSRVALSIRKNLQLALTPQAIADRIAFFESHTPSLIGWSADVILTNWCRFDLRGPLMDMGWGRPFEATSGAVTLYPPGYSIMMQDGDTGDVTVLLTIECDGGQHLLQDPLLNKYATLL
ncbi:hypothetical protein SAMD00019534_010070 [Acytostelium subglobosum LB1]|uniref:hypothetical protein n=1 Tax=Acytostelium subglobosum LB1 TaxID=1410327 RepID=UPI000644B185|nr:hypothetical protein SAMD00019534_010070 [Acytostelium subglobosum LB1]GAM17832.1 hypothetical protein SAMD00019534_010070 [Acytostelium subglobosum LB1]|eukprot:XP_012758428.1 hypothetical protein SAMD00019534_010070 [Acytostelium subglobosum LB1]